jgi:hypothetical protein
MHLSWHVWQIWTRDSCWMHTFKVCRHFWEGEETLLFSFFTKENQGCCIKLKTVHEPNVAPTRLSWFLTNLDPTLQNVVSIHQPAFGVFTRWRFFFVSLTHGGDTDWNHWQLIKTNQSKRRYWLEPLVTHQNKSVKKSPLCTMIGCQQIFGHKMACIFTLIGGRRSNFPTVFATWFKSSTEDGRVLHHSWIIIRISRKFEVSLHFYHCYAIKDSLEKVWIFKFLNRCLNSERIISNQKYVCRLGFFHNM